MFRFFGDTEHWNKYGYRVEPQDFMGLEGLKEASEKWDEELFAYEEPEQEDGEGVEEDEGDMFAYEEPPREEGEFTKDDL